MPRVPKGPAHCKYCDAVINWKKLPEGWRPYDDVAKTVMHKCAARSFAGPMFTSSTPVVGTSISAKLLAPRPELALVDEQVDQPPEDTVIAMLLDLTQQVAKLQEQLEAHAEKFTQYDEWARAEVVKPFPILPYSTTTTGTGTTSAGTSK